MTSFATPSHGLRVGVDALRLEQHPTAERQLPHHAGTGQQRQHRAQFLVGEPLEFTRFPVRLSCGSSTTVQESALQSGRLSPTVQDTAEHERTMGI